MRVHNTETGHLQDRKADEPYAILSHTWDGKEQTFQDVERIQTSIHLSLTRRVLHWILVVSLLLIFLAGVASTYYSGLSPDSADAGTQYGPIFRAGISFVPALLVWLPWLEEKVYGSLTQHSMLEDPRLSEKIRKVCAIARRNKYTQIWVDISCIDRTNNSELSQAINSMFQWYRDAAVCYVYLPDVPSSVDHHHPGSAFRYSRWFTRGWTLQELLAPRVVVFLSRDWEVIGTKEDLADTITDITGIDRDVLLNRKPLAEVSVAARMSWAAERSTTHIEDQAYCLLGIFGIVMTLIYGEGSNAFRRLQEKILRRIPDDSIFAWELMPEQRLASISSSATHPRASSRTHLMRLLDTTTGEFVDRPENSHISYAIVSHIWDKNEVKYGDILAMQRNTRARLCRTMVQWLVSSLLKFFLRPLASTVDCTRILYLAFKFRLREWVDHFNSTSKSWCVSILDHPGMSIKIRQACAVARQAGHTRIWIDVGCVDYGSGGGTELSRFIASTYIWFSHAAVCYVYLSDVPSSDDPHAANSKFRSSLWFTRCWTLQELIAPKEIIFLSQEWTELGTKTSLVDIISDITRINCDVLLHQKPLQTVSAAERISWASKRAVSSDIEDLSYSLFGILDITMTPRYGEGKWALRRFEVKVQRRYPHETLREFSTWSSLYQMMATPRQSVPLSSSPGSIPRTTLLAPSPREFLFYGGIQSIRGGINFHDHHDSPPDNSANFPYREYTLTSYGIRTNFYLLALPKSTTMVDMEGETSPQWYLALLSCKDSSLRKQDHVLAQLCYARHQLNSSHITLHVGKFSTAQVRGAQLGLLDLDPGWQQESLIHVPKPGDFSWHLVGTAIVKSVYIPYGQHRSKSTLFVDWSTKPPKATHIMIQPWAKDALLPWKYDITYTGYGTPQTSDKISLSSLSIPFILHLKKGEHEAAIFLPVRPHPKFGYDSGWIAGDDDGSQERLPCGVVTSSDPIFASLVGTGHSPISRKRLLEDLKRCASQNKWSTGTETIHPILIRIADEHYDLRFDITEVSVQVPVN